MSSFESTPYVVGLTGGIASGKSEVARRFHALGAAIVDADVIAREVVAPGSEGLADVVAHFGNDVLAADGQLDRAALRRLVFENPAARAVLESIVHPRVRAAVESQCRASDAPYVLAAIPLLAEGGGRAAYPYFDRILVVDVPINVQRERLVRRDGISAGLADGMIAAQASREQRLAVADDVIVNTAERDALESSAAALDARYRALAARRSEI
ncbi:dephospho-CoA kinase [Cognatilysobacter lacus]|uniref:Dephospho-CoA kinase n=1 Tax=Cognatilysobacter lacus TaxID=1643323 RepID=A0A5D8Z883_9GAMM|nr:dephospho-CoA kinase [Lysobacter lacus]TZF90850.1 dephospho-CoA kinase [Lysobacter lacus]